MADQFTLLEDELDKLYRDGRDQMVRAGFVQSWDDYVQRRGYLCAIEDVGAMIKRIRNPEAAAKETGEIPSILDEVVNSVRADIERNF